LFIYDRSLSYINIIEKKTASINSQSHLRFRKLTFTCKQQLLQQDFLTKHTDWVQQNSMILSVLFKKWNVCKHIPKEETRRKEYTTLGCVILRDIKMRCTCNKYLNKILLKQCNNSILTRRIILCTQKILKLVKYPHRIFERLL